jgi:uncharacterized protein (DUF433 family)
MATAAKTTAYPHIEKTADVRAGKTCIEGTRIAVADIVRLEKQGVPTNEMVDYFARPLTLAQVKAIQEEYRRRHQSQ